MTHPTISIITPSLNQAEFLETTIRSVLDQRYPALEYIVIDGGSSDGSVDIIRKYEKHLAYWCSEPDEGQYHAIAKGLDMATGDIMAWINSDDFYVSGAFSVVGAVMGEQPSVDWVTTSLRLGADRAGNILYTAPAQGYSRAGFLDGANATLSWPNDGYIQQESTFWRRSLWDAAAREALTRYGYAGDFALWGAFFRRSDLHAVPSPLGVFRLHDAQKTNAMGRYVNEVREILGELRAETGWRLSPLRAAVRLSHITRVPVVRRPFASLFGYRGRRLARYGARGSDARWILETYPYL